MVLVAKGCEVGVVIFEEGEGGESALRKGNKR